MIIKNKKKDFLISIFLLLLGYIFLYVFLQNFGSKKIKHFYPYFTCGIIIIVTYLFAFYCRKININRLMRIFVYILGGVGLGIAMLLLNLFWEQYILDFHKDSVYVNVIDKKSIVMNSLKNIFSYSYFNFPVWIITMIYGLIVEVVFKD